MEPKLDLSSVTLAGSEDTITLSGSSGYTYANTVVGGGYVHPLYGAVPNVTVAGSNTYGYPNVVTGGTGGGITITGAGATSAPYWTTTTASPWLGNGISTEPGGSGKLRLDGANADVEINGVSLAKTIKEIQERLNILTVNPEMEKEWDQLRELGDQYRALEAKLKEQGEMWARLKAMPPPEID